MAPVDIVDENTGEVILECNEELTQEHLDELKEPRHQRVPVALPRPADHRGRRCATPCSQDKTLTQEEAIIEIYRRLRPGDPPTVDTATNLFRNLFFNPERYDLSRVGRLKVNHKLGFFDPEERVELGSPRGRQRAPKRRSRWARSSTLRRRATSSRRSSTWST